MTDTPASFYLPALLLALFLALILARLIQYYAYRTLRRDFPFDEEMLARGESVLLGQPLRQAFAWSTRPFLWFFERARVHPNVLTVGSFLISVGAGVLIAFGQVGLGGVAGIIGASFDYFDGRVARDTGRSSRAGAFLDSTLDRYCDVAFMSGAAILFRDSVPMLAACLLGMGSAVTISYTRAKAESLGAELKVGLMQRAERVVLFCVGAILSPYVDLLLAPELRDRHLFFAGTVALLALLSTATTAHRTLVGLRALRLQDRADDGPGGEG